MMNSCCSSIAHCGGGNGSNNASPCNNPFGPSHPCLTKGVQYSITPYTNTEKMMMMNAFFLPKPQLVFRPLQPQFKSTFGI